MHHLRPCTKDDTATAAAHFSVGFSGGARRLLAGGGADSTHCQKKVRRTRFLEFRLQKGCRYKLLLVVGTKLEHIITQLAHEVAEKHSAIEGILDWARGAKKNKKTRIVNGENASRTESAEGILLQNIAVEDESAVGGRKAEITQV
ncbi:hypothetical protein BHE74_00017352 [Ensete ventricosum]|nr:hypothetical protein BHE74_00017352 [Ensete ventricosum]RZR81382.1 hypothetical protein BHM03_00007588 [Ensete ventricosum]